MKLSLVVLEGKTQGKEIPIRLAQFVIGRDPQCHLRPISPLISKRHCAVLIRDDKAYLRDFESTNGSAVNQKPVKGEVEIHDGDFLRIGPLSFRVKLDVTAAADKPTPKPPTATKDTVHGTGQKTPVPQTAPAGGDRPFDEDSVAEMLLNIEGDPASVPVPGSADDPVPPGSTIMEMTGMAAPGAEPAKPGEGGKKTEKKPIDPASTANAAKAILEKYMRRPRT